MISKIIPVKITTNNTVTESQNPNEEPDRNEMVKEITKDKMLIFKARNKLVNKESPD